MFACKNCHFALSSDRIGERICSAPGFNYCRAIPAFTCRAGCGEIVHDEDDLCGPCAADHADADLGDMFADMDREEALVTG